jgi:hypothetical protein
VQSRKFTEQGIRQEMLETLKGSTAAQMRRARLPIDRAARELKDRRAALKRPVLDRTDVVAAGDRREIRSRLQSLPHIEQVKILLNPNCDSRILEALLDGPRELSGVADDVYAQVESAQLERLHGPALREIEEMESAVAEAVAAVDVARNDVRAQSGLEERSSAWSNRSSARFHFLG